MYMTNIFHRSLSMQLVILLRRFVNCKQPIATSRTSPTRGFPSPDGMARDVAIATIFFKNVMRVQEVDKDLSETINLVA